MNNFKPFDDKYFNKKSIANNEDMNVEVRPEVSIITGPSLNSIPIKDLEKFNMTVEKYQITELNLLGNLITNEVVY